MSRWGLAYCAGAALVMLTGCPPHLGVATTDLAGELRDAAPVVDHAVSDPAIVDAAGPDLTTFDFATPDLATPDLALPDLARPDLSLPDLATPDLALPDLALPDLALPDLRAPADLAAPPDLVVVTDMAGPPMANAKMSFFLTSVGKGGGNFGGLAGADQFCTQLIAATNAPAAVKNRVWRAFLSTTAVKGGAQNGVNAIDRIGAGPFADFNGAPVDPKAMGGIPTSQILTETGQPVPDPDVDRDVLTGSLADGTVDPAAYADAMMFGFTSGNCENWTNANGFARAYVGHADWSLASSPVANAVKSWSSSHYRTCALNAYNAEPVGGGRIYCFGQ